MLSDWSNYEKWVEDGSMDTTKRASLIWKKLLKDYEPPTLDSGIDEELRCFVEKQKTTIKAH